MNVDDKLCLQIAYDAAFRAVGRTEVRYGLMLVLRRHHDMIPRCSRSNGFGFVLYSNK